jgi:hypothetical protein
MYKQRKDSQDAGPLSRSWNFFTHGFNIKTLRRTPLKRAVKTGILLAI